MRDRPSIQNVGLYRVPFLEAYPEVLRRTCIVMPTQAGSVDNLFLNTLKDLQTKITSNDSYQMLMAAALLRKLLIDGNSLTEQVNRNKRLRLAFTFNDKKPLDETGLIFWSIQDGFDPDTSIARLSPLTVKKEGLLKSTSMVINGKVITVLALIRFLCHIQGAVHIDDPSNDEEEVLKAIEENITVGGQSPVIRSICAISRVVLKGLEPLKQEVLKGKEENTV